MKTTTQSIIAVIMALVLQNTAIAQRKYDIPKYKASDATKVVLVVDNKSGQAVDLVMFSSLKKGDTQPGKTYYAGVLYGRYKHAPKRRKGISIDKSRTTQAKNLSTVPFKKLNDANFSVKLDKNAILILNAAKTFLPGDHFLP